MGNPPGDRARDKRVRAEWKVTAVLLKDSDAPGAALAGR